MEPRQAPGSGGDGIGPPSGPAGALAVVARELVVEMGGARILDRVSLAVAAGRMVAVVGPNGSGKTTLLRCIAGLLPADGGEVEVAGRPVSSYRRRELARVVSCVPQGDVRADDLTVREFVELGRFPWIGPWGGLTAADEAAVDEALELTEVTPFERRVLGSLSGGERQRVAIAAAIAQGGRILLLDEPTAALDVRHQVHVLKLLERLHRRAGLTVVAVTHDLNTLLGACDAVVALRAGRVVFEGAPADLLEPMILERVFDAVFDRVPRAGGRLPVVLPAGGGR